MYKKSNAHRLLLNTSYHIPIPYDKKFDNYDKLLFEKYIQKRMTHDKNKE